MITSALLKAFVTPMAKLIHEKPLAGIALVVLAYHFYFLYLAAQALQANAQNFLCLAQLGVTLSAVSTLVLIVVALHKD